MVDVEMLLKNSNTRKKIDTALQKIAKLEPSRLTELITLELQLKQKYIGINDLFPTEIETIEGIFDQLPLYRNCLFDKDVKILEGSAGFGNLADILSKGWKQSSSLNPVNIDVCEINKDFHSLLDAKGYNIVGNDFLELKEQYDIIFINPPFSDEIKHIQHAYSSLRVKKPYNNGYMVSICSNNILKDNNFKIWLESVNGEFYKNNKSNFKNSCTSVDTGFVYITK